MEDLDDLLCRALLGIDTLWGGDFQSPSGANKVLVDAWLSDKPLPSIWNTVSAAATRASKGMEGDPPDFEAITGFLAEMDFPLVLSNLDAAAGRIGGLEKTYIEGLLAALTIMWEIALEKLERGDPVAYDRCVLAATGATPKPSDPTSLKNELAEAFKQAGYSDPADLWSTIRTWRAQTVLSPCDIPKAFENALARLDQLASGNIIPFLEPGIATVRRANCELRPIPDAYFSACLNYVGARSQDGTLTYNSNLELNASRESNAAEFECLISHEVVPGHVTTFAYLQHLLSKQRLPFVTSILTMNTRSSCLFEGIANNALLMAHGVQTREQIPDPDLRIALILSDLEDFAKNHASFLTWHDAAPRHDVVGVLRADFLLSEERATKIGVEWATHPLMGRMSLPIYMHGTDKVAVMLRKIPPEQLYPALYGFSGPADIVTIEELSSGT
jgi:hypothetical protein